MCRRKKLAHHLANVPCLLAVRKGLTRLFRIKSLSQKTKT